MASADRHYVQQHIRRGAIAPFEDGLRTDTTPGTYEWWYFDAHLDDGARLVVTFYTKDYATPQRPLEPMITLDLDLPDGRSLHKRTKFAPAEFHASTERCDVRIGSNRFIGNLRDYEITAAIDDVSVDIRLASLTEPWRLGTGQILFGAREEKSFAWLPSVPYGRVTATYRVGSTVHETTGTGYHDHNWGNTSLLELVNHWYWGRGHLGPYTFISSYIVTEKKYGYTPFPVFMLAHQGKVIADDGAKVTFTKSDVHLDEVTGKPFAGVIRFDYRDGDTQYVLTYSRQRTVVQTRLIESLRGAKKLAARIVGFNGAYLRFSGTLSIDHLRGGERVEHHEADALWELMYFGDDKHERRASHLAAAQGAGARGSEAGGT
jgi:hypothetical protein